MPHSEPTLEFTRKQKNLLKGKTVIVQRADCISVHPFIQTKFHFQHLVFFFKTTSSPDLNIYPFYVKNRFMINTLKYLEFIRSDWNVRNAHFKGSKNLPGCIMFNALFKSYYIFSVTLWYPLTFTFIFHLRCFIHLVYFQNEIYLTT